VCERERERERKEEEEEEEEEEVSFSHFYCPPVQVIQSVFCSNSNDRFSTTCMRTFSSPVSDTCRLCTQVA
jgi:hypothetical protein